MERALAAVWPSLRYLVLGTAIVSWLVLFGGFGGPWRRTAPDRADLHDGTQNRLVGVVMMLGIMQRSLERGPEAAPATPMICWPHWRPASRIWPWWTSGCRRRSPTKACGRRSKHVGVTLGLLVLVLSACVEDSYADDLLVGPGGGSVIR
jgi:hypothetical protein